MTRCLGLIGGNYLTNALLGGQEGLKWNCNPVQAITVDMCKGKPKPEKKAINQGCDENPAAFQHQLGI